ncbi:hypothetical protein BDN67DRAFT_983788 [Paxillus ammoniavirescens]|nr:hypothetical protein BDN67DRAFT_983788 [Paxillus ammoniavirescens]
MEPPRVQQPPPSRCSVTNLQPMTLLKEQSNSPAVMLQPLMLQILLTRLSHTLTKLSTNGSLEGFLLQMSAGVMKLLWEDLGNWRSALKKKACNYIAGWYQWDWQHCPNVNAQITKDLLENGDTFLKNGTDDKGHTNNLAHPALGGLIIDFFYTSPNALGTLFPKVFVNEVLRVTVAIAATAYLKVALDKVVHGQGKVNFKNVWRFISGTNAADSFAGSRCGNGGLVPSQDASEILEVLMTICGAKDWFCIMLPRRQRASIETCVASMYWHHNSAMHWQPMTKLLAPAASQILMMMAMLIAQDELKWGDFADEEDETCFRF